MATEVYTTEILRLQDEEEVTVRPLAIAKLRKFMRLWNDHLSVVRTKMKEVESSEDFDGIIDPAIETELQNAQYDVYIKMCALGLETQLKGERTEKQFISYLEDVLDEQTIFRILDITGGLKLGDVDPNLVTQANLAAQAGTV